MRIHGRNANQQVPQITGHSERHERHGIVLTISGIQCLNECNLEPIWPQSVGSKLSQQPPCVSLKPQSTHRPSSTTTTSLSIIMTSLSRWLRNTIRKAPLAPLHFPTSGYHLVTECLEEESNERFRTGRYYPVNVGDVFASRYQVVGKLGWGVTSTVWLACDLQ